MAVGNFPWDWIYEPFAARDRVAPIVQCCGGYRQAHELLKLPFRRDVGVPKQVDIRCWPSRAPRRAELRGRAARDPARVDPAFVHVWTGCGGVGPVAALDDFEFFTVMPLAWDACASPCVDGSVRFPLLATAMPCDQAGYAS